MSKPSWDEYFMDMTYFVAQRSIDESTKCGCVIVSDDHSVLSLGYNNPPRDCLDHMIPTTRPEKYPYMVHAEENAILNAARHGIPLKNSTFYITGMPCSRCFRGIINVGAKEAIYGVNQAVMCDDADAEVVRLMNQSAQGPIGSVKVRLCKFRGEIGKVHESTRQYMEKKFGTCIIDTEKTSN